MYQIKPETAAKNLTEIALRLKANNIKPVMQSTIFVAATYPNAVNINQKIADLNARIQKFCNTQEVLFIDLNEHLAPDGHLLPENSFDGLHLSANGYQTWGRIIEPIILEAMRGQ